MVDRAAASEAGSTGAVPRLGREEGWEDRLGLAPRPVLLHRNEDLGLASVAVARMLRK